MTKDILFVLEGGEDGAQIPQGPHRSTRDDRDYSVFSYGTSLHKMLDGMFEGGDIDTDLDFQEYLKSCRTGSGGDVLDRTFTDIFLMFDMDLQDQNFDSRRVRKALDYFDDSTENGKMYINYPMLNHINTSHILMIRHISTKEFLWMTSTITRKWSEKRGIPHWQMWEKTCLICGGGS
ncbi:hypothetical protein PED39_04780 [Methanomassiliicoccales archaeon LGM-RCC1]|nr:hypothetical protein PED39_04780 [Methanomassiliicoccales archaeon LGM-RCC1]